MKNQNSIRTSKEECVQENLCFLDAWEIYKHADNLYHQRFNFFLVAESMLIVSFATTLLVDQKNFVLSAHTNLIRIAITILGMVFTFSWFYVNFRINRRLDHLNKEYLMRCSRTYRDYIYSVKCIPSKYFMTYLLPPATFLFWFYLLCTALYIPLCLIIIGRLHT